jgi:hypothetical protein
MPSWQNQTQTALKVVLALAKCPHQGATYEGLKWLLGYQSSRSARRAVAVAISAGLVTKLTIGPGRGNKTVVRLTPLSKALLKQAGL